MNKKVFVFLDIDGTIYTRKHGIPDSTQKAIRLLKENGHHPVICTGRTKCMIFQDILELGFDGIISGAGTYGEWQGEKLFDDNISSKEAEELVCLFRKHGFHAYAEGHEHLCYDPAAIEDPLEEAKRVFSLKDPNVLKAFGPGTEGIEKVSGLFTAKSNDTGVIRELKGRYNVVNHGNYLLETFPLAVSKGTAIRKLLSHLGADLTQTYAYGDSFNDLSMLETVENGVVMGNGDPKLLDQIPLHAGRIEEDGLYLSLKKFGLIGHI